MASKTSTRTSEGNKIRSMEKCRLRARSGQRAWSEEEELSSLWGCWGQGRSPGGLHEGGADRPLTEAKGQTLEGCRVCLGTLSLPGDPSAESSLGWLGGEAGNVAQGGLRHGLWSVCVTEL